MSNFAFYLAAFLLMLGVLIIVHEYGHYIVARWAGVKVLKFSVGFGRSIFSKRFGRDGTEWAIGIFPLGGYVKMLDEREGVVAPEELHRAFNQKTVWRRIAIVAAGPLANLLLAVLVYWGLFYHGMAELKPVFGTPIVASAAAAAGIENGELVLKVDGVPVQTWEDMRWELLKRAVDKNVLGIEVINSRHEIALRQLDFSGPKEEGWQGDALDKLGIRLYRPVIRPLIAKISPNSAAFEADLRSGDEVLAINGQPVKGWSDVVRRVRSSPDQLLQFEVLRQGERHYLDIRPTALEENEQRIGRIGASIADDAVARASMMITVSYGLVPALGKALHETWDKSVFSLVMIGKMITGAVSWRNISGPVTIADYAGQSAQLGLDYYLKFLALVSISLAVLNLLPIPILDGGHLLYYAAEIIMRKPLSERSMEIGQQIGLSLLLLLMAFAFYNDINRLLVG